MVPPTSGAAVARLGISKDRPVSRSEASRAARPVTNIPDPLPCHSRHTGFRSRFHLPLRGRLVYVPDLSEFLRARLWHAQNSSKNRFALASRSPRIAPSSSERSTRTSRAPTSRCAARQSRVCHQCWRLRRLSRQPIRCGHPHAASGRWRRAIDTATRRRAVGRETRKRARRSLCTVGDLRLAYPRQPHRPNQIVDTAVDTPPIPGLLDYCDQRLLGALAGLQKRREVAALPQFQDAQLQRAKPGIEGAIAVTVAPVMRSPLRS